MYISDNSPVLRTNTTTRTNIIVSRPASEPSLVELTRINSNTHDYNDTRSEQIDRLAHRYAGVFRYSQRDLHKDKGHDIKLYLKTRAEIGNVL